MNEIGEVPREGADTSALSDMREYQAEFQNAKDYWDYFVNSIKEYSDSEIATSDSTSDTVKDREYGVHECADVAIRCFKPEIIREWINMGLDNRNAVIQEYSNGIGEALGINFKGIVWEQFPVENGMYTYGYNAGDGYVHLNVEMLADPAQLMRLIDTVAHEARHQLQNEAMANPSKFPIDEATVNEWRTGKDVYTLEMPSAYDPWGYVYNPMEVDAKFFGETMVRELTKHIINNA